MKKAKSAIIDWLIQSEVIGNDDRELYEYALNSLFLLMAPFFYASIIGLFLGNLIQGMFLIIPFVVLRKYSGGYHSKNLGVCLVSSGVLLLLCAIISKKIEFNLKLFAITIIGAISIIKHSPIDNENRKIDVEEIYMYKKNITYIILVLLFLDFGIFLFDRPKYATFLSIGIQLVAFLQLPCIFRLKN